MSKTIAIATENPEAYSQTFVLRHINELHGGNTVVLLTKNRKLKKITKPSFIYPKRKSLFSNIRKYLGISNRRFTFKNPIDSDLRAFLIKHNVGFVLAEFGYIGVRLFAVIKELNIPMYCYFRGSDASRKLSERKYVESLKNMMPSMSGIIAVSQSLIDNLRLNGIYHRNAHVIPSGVDTAIFKPSDKEKFLLAAVGRFVEKKAPDITIKAFAIVKEQFPCARLEMVGDGPMLDLCKNLANELGLGDSIIFHGPKPHDFIKDLLSRASVFLQHSVKAPNGDLEGMPTAIQEAMASGAVVISTNHSGIPEHVRNNVTGFTVEEHQLDSYADAIIKIMADNPLRESIASNSRKYAINYLDYKVNYAKLERLILRC